ncbi:MAG: DUF4270 domain-containing protein [Sphingobacteriales bacterium]|nr:DUF4270 domain-containing protein [Sphingobacteriales bacterium]
MKFAFLRYFCLFFLGISTIFFANSCGETSTLGLDLIEPEQYIDALKTDTLQLWVNTIPSDSLITSLINNQERNFLLGAINNDPYFGQSAAHLYTQVRLTQNNLNLPNDATLDSVVLVLAYASEIPYGTKYAPNTVRVYELTEPMDADTTYYQNQTLAHNPTPLTEKSGFVHRYTDSLAINTVLKNKAGKDSVVTKINVAPQLRFTLPNEIGERIINETDTAKFANSEAFSKFIKGFYFEADAANQNIAYFSLFNPQSRLVLYYHTNGVFTTVDFPMGANTAVFNHYEHNYSGYPAGNALAQPAPNGNEQLFLKSMAGLGFELKIPNLNKLGNIVVNKAELEMYIVPQTNYTYQTPGELAFTPGDTSGKVITSFARNAQRNTSDTTWLNIAPIPVTNSRYTLLLTEYLQQKLIEPQITNAADRFLLTGRFYAPTAC